MLMVFAHWLYFFAGTTELLGKCLAKYGHEEARDRDNTFDDLGLGPSLSEKDTFDEIGIDVNESSEQAKVEKGGELRIDMLDSRARNDDSEPPSPTVSQTYSVPKSPSSLHLKAP